MIFSFFFHLNEQMRSMHLVYCIGESSISFETVQYSIFMGNSNERNI